jgi:hypothetical protein
MKALEALLSDGGRNRLAGSTEARHSKPGKGIGIRISQELGTSTVRPPSLKARKVRKEAASTYGGALFDSNFPPLA